MSATYDVGRTIGLHRTRNGVPSAHRHRDSIDGRVQHRFGGRNARAGAGSDVQVRHRPRSGVGHRAGSEGAVCERPFVAGLRSPRRRSSSNHLRLSPGRGGGERGATLRHQRQHGEHAPGRTGSGDAPSELAGRRRTRRPFSPSTPGSRRSRRLRPVFASCRARCRRSCRSERRRSTTRSQRRPNASERAKAAVAPSSSSATAATTPAGWPRATCRESRARLTCRFTCLRRCRRSTIPAPNFRQARGRSSLTGPLSDLAARTGGHVFVASTPAARSAAARQIVDELRHQYLIAFESSGTPGWHPLVVRARNKDLVVRARSGYIAGQSRPSSD